MLFGITRRNMNLATLISARFGERISNQDSSYELIIPYNTSTVNCTTKNHVISMMSKPVLLKAPYKQAANDKVTQDDTGDAHSYCNLNAAMPIFCENESVIKHLHTEFSFNYNARIRSDFFHAQHF